MGSKGLFPMRRHHGKEYNIFREGDDKYVGKVFDRNRRIYSVTPAYNDIEKVIKFAKMDCELYAKGMCVNGTVIDEGKPIRIAEDKNYLKFKKEMRKVNRKRGVTDAVD